MRRTLLVPVVSIISLCSRVHGGDQPRGDLERHTLHPAAIPKSIDVEVFEGPGLKTGETLHILGIYEFEGDGLTLCTAAPGKPRPPAFASSPGSGLSLQTWARVLLGRPV